MGGVTTITHLQWDTNFFGFNTARIDCGEKLDISQIMNELRVKYRLCYFFSETRQPEIEKRGGELMDIKVTFSIELNKIDSKKNNEIIEYPYNDVKEEMIELAYLSGTYSRFRIDKNFNKNVFESLYKTWITKSILKEIADYVYVFLQNNQILGMVTLSCKKIATIGLIAVNSNASGQKIGSKLIDKVIEICKLHGCDYLEVPTQKDNVSACNFYLKNGFKVQKEEYIYHLWL